MSRFVIAFQSFELGVGQKILEATSIDEALKLYFESYVVNYSKDSEGYACFLDDFNDEETPMGSILEIKNF